MSSETPGLISGNAAIVSKATRGWFLGHFMPGEENPLRTEALELKWYTHAKGETREQWAPGNPVKTLNVLVRGHFVLLFPDQEVSLEKEGDFVFFWPRHSALFSLYRGVSGSDGSLAFRVPIKMSCPAIPGR